jgi:hypothetical protein
MRLYSILLVIVLLFSSNNPAIADPFSLICSIPKHPEPDEYFGIVTIDADKRALTIAANGRGSVGTKSEFTLTSTERTYKGAASGESYHSTFTLDRKTGRFTFHMVTYRNDISDDKFSGDCKSSVKP